MAHKIWRRLDSLSLLQRMQYELKLPLVQFYSAQVTIGPPDVRFGFHSSLAKVWPLIVLHPHKCCHLTPNSEVTGKVLRKPTPGIPGRLHFCLQLLSYYPDFSLLARAPLYSSLLILIFSHVLAEEVSSGPHIRSSILTLSPSASHFCGFCTHCLVGISQHSLVSPFTQSPRP